MKSPVTPSGTSTRSIHASPRTATGAASVNIRTTACLSRGTIRHTSPSRGGMDSHGAMGTDKISFGPGGAGTGKKKSKGDDADESDEG